MTDLDRARMWYADEWPLLFCAQEADAERRIASLTALLEQVRAEAVEEALVEIANIHDVGHPPWEHCGCALAAAIRARSESKETPA